MNPRSFLGSNLNLVKAHNLQAILLNFLYNERLSRVELARQISLSTTTITNLTAELLEDGIIVEFFHPYDKKIVQQFWTNSHKVRLLEESE